MLASALVPEKLSAIRRCPLFGVSAIGRFLKYSIYGKRSWYIAHCPLYGRCPLFGVSAKSVYIAEINILSFICNTCFHTALHSVIAFSRRYLMQADISHSKISRLVLLNKVPSMCAIFTPPLSSSSLSPSLSPSGKW